MDELGYLDDPADLLGMLDGQSLRAARVIVDIGMHLELDDPGDNRFGPGGTAFHPGETWTPELGLEFMRRALPDGRRVHPVRGQALPRLPGQAPSYKVGERIWLEARDGRAGSARATTSTSRPSTERPSTSARWGSTR